MSETVNGQHQNCLRSARKIVNQLFREPYAFRGRVLKVAPIGGGPCARGNTRSLGVEVIDAQVQYQIFDPSNPLSQVCELGVNTPNNNDASNLRRTSFLQTNPGSDSMTATAAGTIHHCSFVISESWARPLSDSCATGSCWISICRKYSNCGVDHEAWLPNRSINRRASAYSTLCAANNADALNYNGKVCHIIYQYSF